MPQLGQWNNLPAWLAAFGERELSLLAAPAAWSPTRTQATGCQIIFDGMLWNRDELQERFGDHLSCDSNDADIVAQAYRFWGHDVLLQVKGAFALIIWDSTHDLLLCARDPLGMYPLFYAEVGRTLLLSPSIETLLDHPGVSAELNRAGLVDHLARRWLKRDETYFTHVRRVPPGHVMQVGYGQRQVYRYWEPVPLDRPLEWLPDEEAQERFETLFEQAVVHALRLGPVGLFLSGGLDSSTVAMVTRDLCQRQGQAMPWTLSLLFSGLDCDEQIVQQGVAASLGLPQVQLRFDEIDGPGETLATALEMSRNMPAPLSMIWRPAFCRLAFEGQQRGCQVILTGEGADEWLGVNSFLAADLLKNLDVRSFYRLWRTISRSYPFSQWAELRSLLWRYGARPVLRETWRTSAVLAPIRRRLLQRRLTATLVSATMPWIVPEPTLRAQVAQRLEEAWSSDAVAPTVESFYLQYAREILDNRQKWLMTEETFLLGRRINMRLYHPFWDANLVALLIKMRPHVKIKEGRTKSLIRHLLIRRFPGLGFESRRKSYIGSLFLAIVSTQAHKVRQTMGNAWTLGELGVIDPLRMKAFLDNPPAQPGPRWCTAVWDILNLEAWARAHYRSSR